ncbi:hypothetical protein C8R42DRAFT_296744 [Lentinula raphanica]|nr:hypothetical protein C8R42DRAFT_296744 [Lentinula raphanica]
MRNCLYRVINLLAKSELDPSCARNAKRSAYQICNSLTIPHASGLMFRQESVRRMRSTIPSQSDQSLFDPLSTSSPKCSCG